MRLLILSLLTLMLGRSCSGQKLSRGIKFHEGFENKTAFAKGWTAVEFGVNGNISRVSDKTRAGGQAVVIRLHKDDPESQWGNKRTEFTYNNYRQEARIDESLRWYAFSNYFPAEYAADPAEEVIAQFHDRSERCSASPTLALEIINDRFRAVIRYSTSHYCEPGSQVVRSFDLGPVLKEQWLDWVIYYDPRTDSTGRVRIWMNEKEMLSYEGPCHYIGSVFPYFKIGLYKWQWMPGWKGLQSNQQQRLYYLDEIIIGDQNVEPKALRLKN